MDAEFDIVRWNELKIKLKQNYPHLTNADLLWRHGSEAELLRMIALKLGKTKRQLQETIEDI